MSNLNDISDWLADRLPALLAEHQVPGAAVAVYAGGQVIDAAAGLLSTATGVAATADSVFQVGSITKLWTSTLVMQLVDEGLLDLDAPIRRYLPEFALVDEAAAAAITTRQLLSHTAGFEGDLFTDTGRGEDCVEKYVATLAETTQLFAPGEMFSYNNAGFCVLGRIVEVLRGQQYDEALRTHLITPLGLTHVATSADEAILHRAAVGHIQPDPTEPPRPAPVWSLTRSNAPAGAMLAMRPRDLLGFARMHMDGGVASDGTLVLSPGSIEAMRERQVSLPELGMMGDAWGLGWEIYDWPGATVYGHDGGTIGQSAFFRMVPEKDVAIALLTNGGNTIALYLDIFRHILRELAGVEMPSLPTPPAQPQDFDATRYLGTYSCEVSDFTVTQDGDGRVWLEQIPKGIIATLVGVERHELVRVGDDRLMQAGSQRGMHPSHVFLGDDGTGHALYIHSGRATRRANA